MSDVKTIQADSVVFLNVPKAYLPQEDLTVRFERCQDVPVGSRDWVGLFRVGWTSTRDYYTFEWATVPSDNQADNKVIFAGRRLPADDGCFYQFCYVSREGTLRGASAPFQFTKAAHGLNADDVVSVDVVEEGLESIVELRHRETTDAMKETPLATAKRMAVAEATIEHATTPVKTEQKELAAELTRIQERLATVEREKAEKSTRLDESQSQLRALKDVQARLTERLEKEVGISQEHLVAREKAELRCQEIESTCAELRAQLELVNSEKQNAILQLSKSKQQLEQVMYNKDLECQALKESMEALIEDLKAKNMELQDALLQKDAKFASIENQLMIDKQQLEADFTDRMSSLQIKLCDFEERARNSEEKIMRLKHELAEEKQQHEEHMAEKTEQHSCEVNLLQNALQQSQELNDQLKNQLSQYQQGDLDKARNELTILTQSSAPQTISSTENVLPVCRVPPDGFVDKAAHEALQIAYENIEKYYRKVSTELESCKIELKDRDDKVKRLNGACEEMTKRIEMCRNAYEALAKECTALKRALQSKGGDDVLNLLSKIKSLEQQVMVQGMLLQESKDESSKQDDDLQRRISELDQELIKSRLLNDTFAQEKARLAEQCSKSLAEVADLNGRVQMLQDYVTEMQENLSTATQELIKRNDTVKSLESELAISVGRTKELEDAVGELRGQVAEMQKNLNATTQELAERNEIIKALRSQLAMRADQTRELEGRQERKLEVPIPSPKVCPVCSVTFPARMASRMFENHVQSHF